MIHSGIKVWDLASGTCLFTHHANAAYRAHGDPDLGGVWPGAAGTPAAHRRSRSFLTGPGAASYSESVMSLVEHYHLGEIVGAATAGANGNKAEITEPTGCRTPSPARASPGTTVRASTSSASSPRSPYRGPSQVSSPATTRSSRRRSPTCVAPARD